MRTSYEILAKLKEKGITNAAIGVELGIHSANVSTLFKPGANGKLRQLGYDEAFKLVNAFGLIQWFYDGARDPNYSRSGSELMKALVGYLISNLPVGFTMTHKAKAEFTKAIMFSYELLDGESDREISEAAIRIAAKAGADRFQRAIGMADQFVRASTNPDRRA